MTRIRTALNALCDGLRLDARPRGELLARLDADAWLDLVGLANATRLGPALYASLADDRRLDVLPSDAHDYLDLLYRHSGDRNAVLWHQATELAGELNAVGVRPLLLKGVLVLAIDRDRDPASRIMSDIDFAVPPGTSWPVEQSLMRLGYRVNDRYPAGHHAVAEYCRAGDPAAVDLHEELIDQSYVLPAAEVFARARSMTADGATFLVPAATDRLLHVLLHAQIHHLGQFYCGRISLDQLYDFCRIAAPTTASDDNAADRQVDWGHIDTRLRKFGLTAILDSYLIAADRLFGFAWPLDRSPLRGADRQLRRWLRQLHVPALAKLDIPAGNLAAAFAWHRMHALYGERGGPLYWRYAHLRQFLKRHGPHQTVARVLRGIRAST
jgi:hypothetical protein